MLLNILFFFQAEDGIRDYKVTGVQTCALPISLRPSDNTDSLRRIVPEDTAARTTPPPTTVASIPSSTASALSPPTTVASTEIGRASCRERGESSGADVS